MNIRNWRAAVAQAKDVYMPGRVELYAMYEDALDDPFLYAAIRTARMKVVSAPFRLVDNQSQTPSDAHTLLLQRPWFDRYAEIFVDTEFWGHSLIEFRPLRAAQSELLERELEAVILIPREHVRPETGDVLLDIHNLEGIRYRGTDFMQSMMEMGDPFALGLLEKVLRSVIHKLYSLGDWSRFNERFGMPMVTVKTATRNKEELDAKEEMLANLGRNGYAILDDMDEISFIEAQKSRPFETYLENARYADQMIELLINGQNMNDQDGGSRARDEVKERILNTYTRARLRALQYHVNFELFPKLIEMGYPLQGYTFQYTDLLEQQANADPDGGLPDKQQDFKHPASQADGAGFDPSAIVACYASRYCETSSKEPQASMSTLLKLTKRIKTLFIAFAQKLHQGEAMSSEQAGMLTELTAEAIKETYRASYRKLENTWDELDRSHMEAIEANILRFSGAKSAVQVKALQDALFKDGQLLPWTAFRERALTLNSQYNEHYLLVEYNHARRAGAMGSRWVEIQRTKAAFPYLKYVTAGDERVREHHQILDGMVGPVDDPIWNEIYPPNGWNCRCSVEELSLHDVQSGKVKITDPDRAKQLAGQAAGGPSSWRAKQPESLIFKTT
jgi:SPP1 gp7 family putative phage head morphogenesis protein